MCCNSWGRKESDMTEGLNRTELITYDMKHLFICFFAFCIFPLVLSLVAQWWRIHLPKQKTLVQSLGQEDPLEKEMATAPVYLPGKSHGQRSLVGYCPWGRKRWTPLSD